MKSRTLLLVLCVALLSAAAGWLASSWRMSSGTAENGATGDGPCPGGAQANYWKAPMDPSYVRDRPGKSPMGMDLVPVCPGDDEGRGDGVRVASNVLQNMGVRTIRVRRRDLSRKIRAVGRIEYDERRISHVHTKIQGWIEKLYVEYEGQRVRQGQRMLEVYSPELFATQEELLVAARYRSKMASSPFEDVRKGGEDLFEATRRRLELWDIPDRDIERLLSTGDVRRTAALYAPSSGIVTKIMARQGMEVGPNDNLFTIADLSRVWVYADVYEYEIPWVDMGETAKVELRSMPGMTYDATVTYVYPYLDAKTRTVRVRLELPNPDGTLKPEMFATVTIDAERHPNALSVPESAVIRSGRRNLVILALGEGRFDPREVELGLESGDGWIEVRSGLSEDDVVVDSGQFLIDSESRLREAVQTLAGHDSASEADSEAPTEHTMGGRPETDPHAGHVMPGED
jgi:Cu(I)/Ag(I) efflux system membrane fusion protein/cobalt-zinc-cadmium efflux system membrane fusion protein